MIQILPDLPHRGKTQTVAEYSILVDCNASCPSRKYLFDAAHQHLATRAQLQTIADRCCVALENAGFNPQSNASLNYQNQAIAMSSVEHIVEANEQNFEALVIEESRKRPVLVDFWADWCQPCQMLMPVLAVLANRYQGKFLLVKVNTESHQSLAAQFGVRSLPTVKLFRDGAVADEFVGALPETEIMHFLDRYIESAADKLVEEAVQMLAAGQQETAISMAAQALEDDPDNPGVIIANINILLHIGSYDDARQLLSKLTSDARESAEVRAIEAKLFFFEIASVPPTDDDNEIKFHRAATLVLDGDYDNAFEELMSIMQQDRKFRDDGARKAMLSLFELLGSDQRVKGFRTRMFNMLH